MEDGDEGGSDEVMNDLENECKGDDPTRCGVDKRSTTRLRIYLMTSCFGD